MAVVVIVLLVRRQRRLALWAAVTTIVAGLLGDGLKTVVARARPVLPEPVAHAPGFSFPSGHALNSFVFFGILLLLVLPLLPRAWRWVAWAVAVGGTLLVGFDRVALGVHYVSDVVGGWLLGAGLLAMSVAAFESWRRSGGRGKPSVLEEGVDPAGSRAAVRTGNPPPR
jgi:membrane-associated phospholipid phosphatase